MFACYARVVPRLVLYLAVARERPCAVTDVMMNLRTLVEEDARYRCAGRGEKSAVRLATQRLP